MNAERIGELIALYRDGLLEDTLPFWIEHSVDYEFGGFMTALDRDGTVIDTDKGMWQQCRFTWLLAHLYTTVEPRGQWLDLARHGLEFILKHGFDVDGRMFFQVARDGTPLRKRRYAFTEAFAAMALAACARATSQEEFAQRAVAAFRAFLSHQAVPKFTPNRRMKSLSVPMLAIGTAQQLRDSIDFQEANSIIDRALEEIRRDFIKPEPRAVMETVGPDGGIIDHFDGRTLNPGHAIECAWFIMHEGKLRNDRSLVETGTTMLDWMWRIGWDEEFGGIFYFRDFKGLPVQEYWHDMKFWWPHNETVIATLLAYGLTGREEYAEKHRMVHDWAYGHFPDPEYGEWFGYLHRDGRLSVRLKGNLWKGPFHLPRMQWYCWRLLEEMREAKS